MRKRILFVTAIILALASSFVVGVFTTKSLAATQQQVVSTTFSYQGKLLDSQNAPVNGSKAITFRIWDNSTGGNLVWSDTYTVTVTDGVFTILLGKNASNPILINDIATHTDLYLEVEVDGSTLSPRDRLTSVPYAVHAFTIADNTVDSNKVVDGTLATADLAPKSVVDVNYKIGVAAASTNIDPMTVIPDMEMTLQTGTDLLEIEFDASMYCTWTNTTQTQGQFAYSIFVDNVELARRSTVCSIQGRGEHVASRAMLPVTAGTHTIQVKWRAATDKDYPTTVNSGTTGGHSRILIVKEYKNN